MKQSINAILSYMIALLAVVLLVVVGNGLALAVIHVFDRFDKSEIVPAIILVALLGALFLLALGGAAHKGPRV